jgi:hypothetical protein
MNQKHELRREQEMSNCWSTINRDAVGAFGFVLFLICSASAAPPSQLYGRTVHVSWNEDIVSRSAGDQNFSHSGGAHLRHLIIYISALGRPFVRRWHATGAGPRGVSEHVGGSGKGEKGGVQTTEFQARSLVWTSASGGGGATRIQIDFDASFGSCTAGVIAGKEAGASSFFKQSGRVEVQSVSSSAATCSIEEGNAFAN